MITWEYALKLMLIAAGTYFWMWYTVRDWEKMKRKKRDE